MTRPSSGRGCRRANSLEQDDDGDWLLVPPSDVTIFSVPGEPLLIGTCDEETARQDAIEWLDGIAARAVLRSEGEA